MSMSRPPRKAVIPAAGLGTRFLPATKAVPKELLPVVDTPVMQYIVEEAVRAGLSEVLVVTGRGKEAIADHFDLAPELGDGGEAGAGGRTEQPRDHRSVRARPSRVPRAATDAAGARRGDPVDRCAAGTRACGRADARRGLPRAAIRHR